MALSSIRMLEDELEVTFRNTMRALNIGFLDDIMVYSATLEEHLQHLQLGLQAMKHNSLYAKMSKCIFAAKQVEYLGQTGPKF
ncbi:putative mitochondrial protein [Tanacetum coccineum]